MVPSYRYLIGSERSLIKYQSEIEISENIEEYKKTIKNQKVLEPKPSAEDVLNNMISPRDWVTPQNKLFMQYVSHQQSSRQQVMKLKQSLDEELNYRQARKEGICPIRQQLFSQAFDQIIREVTLNCAQRGLILMRVRDEHKMTMAAYQTLYQSSVSFGIKKQIESQEGVDQMELEIKKYQKIERQLVSKKNELLSKEQSLMKKMLQRKRIAKQKEKNELQRIAFQADQLHKFLQGLKESKNTN